MEKLSRQQKAILLWVADKTQEKLAKYAGDETHFPYGVWIDWRYNKGSAIGRTRAALKTKPGRISASDRASLSRALKRLEVRGLIERGNSINGGPYTAEIRLTDNGKETVNILNQCQNVNRFENEAK